MNTHNISATDGLPPENLASGEVTLQFTQIIPAGAVPGLVPYYHFRIQTVDGSDIGHINFRVGDTDHVQIYVGHIGFGIAEPFRGRGYAGQACLAIAPFVRSIYETVIITCDSDNLASRRTIERLGATFIDEVTVPAHDPHFQGTPRIKKRYQWRP